jgi:hypothetical protein
MQWLPLLETSVRLIGPVLAPSGAAYTGASVGNFNKTLNGVTSALAAPSQIVHSHNGHYLMTLDDAHVTAEGGLEISLNLDGFFMTVHRYQVCDPANIAMQATILEIKAKTELLGGPPLGSVLFVDTGDYYCTRSDVELAFGVANVTKWADLNNTGNSTFITNRITTMIALAYEMTNDALRAGSYVVPIVAPIPYALSYHTACLAGVLLYESRGEVDSEDENGNHRLTPFRRRWDAFIKGLLGQRVILNAPKSTTTSAPSVR